MTQGLDYAWRHPSPAAVVAGGYGFVMRYLSPDPSKNLTGAEAKALLAVGVDVGAVWESSVLRPLSGHDGGVVDGEAAARQLATIGAPPTMACYFAVDFDASPDQIPAIRDYAVGFKTGLGGRPTGVYGSGFTCNQLSDLVALKWQCMSTGYRQSATLQPGVCLWQKRNVTVDGADCDLNVQYAPFGGWREGADMAPDHPPIPLQPYVSDCACPTGGAWVLAADGSVYAFGGAPFHGAPIQDANGENWKAGNREAAHIEAQGNGYVVVDTADERFGYGV